MCIRDRYQRRVRGTGIDKMLSHVARRTASGLARTLRAQPRLVAVSGTMNQSRSLSAAAEQVSVIFIEKGKEIECTADAGTTLLDVAWDNDIDLEGACDKTLCCSTCHVYVEEDFLEASGEIIEEEEDMLELAGGLLDNSRLGCQILLAPAMNGMRVTVPDEVNNNF
eukprot:TRINITY_DN16373_c0_g1_i5.p1 TRINITY_DN16373_c0_g1~~TRINITY_DN16373_c0_g1_i5.p1  ORF type:complete len:167 (-),score=35.09 TRINITY_DN16373_c0_g1_i5:361-861(-)